ncbi:MAG: hypothetical protein KDG89_14960 [Geminicoccaceae bacterium]|nr:hypothetical protein [Geminicoccaceae bacterium]
MRTGFIGGALFCFMALPALAAPDPVPSCAGAGPVPAYAAPGANPNVAVSPDPAAWRLPACLGWPAAEARVVVALAGRFEGEGVDAVVARLASVSDFARTRYWSTSRNRWRPMFDALVPLSAPDPDARRGDLAPDELTQGATGYLLLDDNDPLGALVDAVSVVERTRDRLVVDIVNVTAASAVGVTAIPKGGLRTRIAVAADGGGAPGLYVLTRLVSGVPGFLLPDDDAYVNRTAAIWRYLAGVPDDREPPLAP